MKVSGSSRNASQLKPVTTDCVSAIRLTMESWALAYQPRKTSVTDRKPMRNQKVTAAERVRKPWKKNAAVSTASMMARPPISTVLSRQMRCQSAFLAAFSSSLSALAAGGVGSAGAATARRNCAGVW